MPAPSPEPQRLESPQAPWWPAQASAWPEVLAHRAAERPQQRAVAYLADGVALSEAWTYAELQQRVWAIASHLNTLGPAGERALLLYPPGLDFVAAFWACLHAGWVPVPALPPRDAKALPKLLAVAEDAGARFALTNQDLMKRTRLARWFQPALRAMHWHATDAWGPDSLKGAPPAARPHELALIQYTSGSTGNPKGVVLSHQNLLANAAMLQSLWAHAGHPGSPERFVSWLPTHHDMGLIGMVLTPVAMGATTTFLSPLHVVQKPERWLRAIAQEQGQVSAAPNFAYDMCLRHAAEHAAELDLSSWRVALNGAEPVRPDTLTRFTEAFAPSGFRPEAFFPAYGLAEATVFVAGGPLNQPPVLRTLACESKRSDAATPPVPEAMASAAGFTPAPDAGQGSAALPGPSVAPPATLPGPLRVGVGRPWGGTQVLVVDPNTRAPLPEGTQGELWVQGPGVGQGYWKQPEASEAVFRATLADGSGPWLRTGDLGVWEGGELFVTGRLKDLVIVRGKKHHPQDLERTMAEAHPDLRPGFGVAFAVDGEGTEALVLVQEVRREATAEAEALLRAVRRAVVEGHDLSPAELWLLPAGTLPKTSSGKVQRAATRQAYLAGTLPRWKGPAR